MVFTIPNSLTRVISARDMNRKKSMKAYEKKIPKFKSEDKEREFWATADSTEYINWEKTKKTVFPKLKPSLKKSPFTYLD